MRLGIDVVLTLRGPIETCRAVGVYCGPGDTPNSELVAVSPEALRSAGLFGTVTRVANGDGGFMDVYVIEVAGSSLVAATPENRADSIDAPWCAPTCFSASWRVRPHPMSR